MSQQLTEQTLTSDARRGRRRHVAHSLPVGPNLLEIRVRSQPHGLSLNLCLQLSQFLFLNDLHHHEDEGMEGHVANSHPHALYSSHQSPKCKARTSPLSTEVRIWGEGRSGTCAGRGGPALGVSSASSGFTCVVFFHLL